MHVDVAPLLERHRICHSRNVEEARAFMQRYDFHMEIDRRQAGALDMRVNGVYLPGMWLGYIHYGPPVAVRAVGRDDYWVQLPVRGRLEVVGFSGSVACDTRRAAIASPTCNDSYLVRSGRGCGGIRLSLTKANLVEHLAALLGEQPAKAPEFAPEMDVTLGHGLNLARYVLMAIADLQGRDSMLANPIVMNSFGQFVMTGLLLSHPHNYSKALRGLDKRISPRDLKRAIDYIQAHLGTSFTVADIVQETGVAGRTLFKHFKDFEGVSPMRFARNARFQRVRQALLRAEPEQSVTGIAMNWGFTHMGRFSIEYRRRFGESPSRTLKRRRGRPCLPHR